MAEVGALDRQTLVRPSVSRGVQFDQYRQKLVSGPVQINDMPLKLAATQAMTLGQFTAYLSGSLSGTPDDWRFQGTMRYSDTYNFESHGEFFLVDREVWTFGVRVSQRGKGFQVKSELAPVKQSSQEAEIQWKGTGVYGGGGNIP